MENWKRIPDWPKYRVSDLGRVKSKHSGKWKLLSPSIGTPAYYSVQLSKKGVAKAFRVHALVMLAFVGPRPFKYETRHLNGNCLDNRLENLAYGTVAENVADAFRHGTKSRLKSCYRGHALIPDNTYVSPTTGDRTCKTCKRETDRKSQQRRTAKSRALRE